jgi:ketosteroid isomerase-like protein
MTSTPRSIAEAYWRAEESRDVKQVLANFHEDAVFHPVTGPLRGHEEIATFYAGMGDTFPTMRVEIVHEVSSGDEASLEWSAILTDHAGIDYPIRGVNIVRVHHGKIAHMTAYFDPTSFPTPKAAS